MSKFIERLKQVSQPPAHPMGFKTAKTEQSRLKIQLVANIRGTKMKPLTKQLTAADALVLPMLEADVAEVIHGAWLTRGNTEEVDQSVRSGIDFVILPTNGDILSPDKEIGKILQIEASITDVLLRTANELPIDAVLLSEGKENGLALTWQRLMLIQRFSSLLNKPLLIEVSANISSNELHRIWETGVSGIVVTVDGGQSEAVLQNLRKVIDGLPFPSQRKRESVMALLPRIAPEPEEPEEDEGGDE
ncbi:MAG: hypothetical protein NTX46_02845 [Chloroflexi bacterium]|nr:hypothetical protein [Chloroflexota bacterium]